MYVKLVDDFMIVYIVELKTAGMYTEFFFGVHTAWISPDFKFSNQSQNWHSLKPKLIKFEVRSAVRIDNRQP